MKFFDLVNDIVSEAYSIGLVKDLISKFEEDGADEDDIIEYIKLFDNVKSKLPNDKKDITKYNWFDLVRVVEINRSTKIKSKKDTSSDLVYNKDGIEIYVGSDHKGCIKYGEGYTFCISARSMNAYQTEYGSYRIKAKGTPYFVFNKNLDNSNPEHLLVVFVFPVDKHNERSNHYQNLAIDQRYEGQQVFYSITNASNRGTIYFNNFDNLIKSNPTLKNLKDIFIPINLKVEGSGNKLTDIIRKSYHAKYLKLYQSFSEKYHSKIYKEQTYKSGNEIAEIIVVYENDLLMKTSRFPEVDFTPRIEYVRYLKNLWSLKREEDKKLIEIGGYSHRDLNPNQANVGARGLMEQNERVSTTYEVLESRYGYEDEDEDDWAIAIDFLLKIQIENKTYNYIFTVGGNVTEDDEWEVEDERIDWEIIGNNNYLKSINGKEINMQLDMKQIEEVVFAIDYTPIENEISVIYHRLY